MRTCVHRRLPYQYRPGELDDSSQRARERAAAELYSYQQQASSAVAQDLEQRPVYEWASSASWMSGF